MNVESFSPILPAYAFSAKSNKACELRRLIFCVRFLVLLALFLQMVITYDHLILKN